MCTYEVVKETDIPLLTFIMKRAFDEDTRRHLGQECGGPDGYDNGEFLRKYALHPDSEAYKIIFEGTVVGAYIVWIKRSGDNFLGTIFIDPGYQDKGLGAAVWRDIEAKYPQTKRWKTETPGFSKRNHNFYVNKCGFHVVKIKNPGNVEHESYQLEKVMQ